MFISKRVGMAKPHTGIKNDQRLKTLVLLGLSELKP